MDIKPFLKDYTAKNVTVGVLGSHSALDVCRGAKDMDFRTLVISEKGRGKTYSDYYKSKGKIGCVDEVLELEKFSDILTPGVQKKLLAKHVIFVPHRSFEVYLKDYNSIENNFKVPMFGNRNLLRFEERTEKPNQYDLLKSAGIKYPKQYKDSDKIDRLVIVKAQQKDVSFERGFFLASTSSEFYSEGKKRIRSGLISEKGLREAVIEEFIVGVAVNFNFFYSPIEKRLELAGTDTRRQTNLDGFLRLTAPQQIEALKYMQVTYKEMGHTAVTIPESLLEDVMEMGERFVKATRIMIKPGVIGPFGLQCLVRPGFPKLELVVYDVAPRMPGSPGIFSTPYAGYLYGENMSMGKRVGIEIKSALKKKSLAAICT